MEAPCVLKVQKSFTHSGNEVPPQSLQNMYTDDFCVVLGQMHHCALLKWVGLYMIQCAGTNLWFPPRKTTGCTGMCLPAARG
eukprot:1160945-Pelagomonas_calceolata.AAC.7